MTFFSLFILEKRKFWFSHFSWKIIIWSCEDGVVYILLAPVKEKKNVVLCFCHSWTQFRKHDIYELRLLWVMIMRLKINGGLAYWELERKIGFEIAQGKLNILLFFSSSTFLQSNKYVYVLLILLPDIRNKMKWRKNKYIVTHTHTFYWAKNHMKPFILSFPAISGVSLFVLFIIISIIMDRKNLSPIFHMRQRHV